MTLHRHDDRDEASAPTEHAHVGAPPPPSVPPPPDLAPAPHEQPPVDVPPPPGPGSGLETALGASPPLAARTRRRARVAWLAGAGVACVVIIAVLLGVRTWDLDGQVSDLSEENDALATENGALDGKVSDLTTENGALDGKVSDLTTERDSIRAIFPLSQQSFADADLRGTYEFLFEPVEGTCTYSDCDQLGPAAYRLSIDRSSTGYTLALEGVEGTPAPMSRDGDVYSASGVLPETLWGACGDTPVETSFELHLTVGAVGLANGELRAVEGSGRYRQYTPDVGLGCGLSEMSFTFDARRAG